MGARDGRVEPLNSREKEMQKRRADLQSQSMASFCEGSGACVAGRIEQAQENQACGLGLPSELT